MSNPRFIVHATADSPPGVAARIRDIIAAAPGLRLVEDAGPMLLVEGNDPAAQRQLAAITGWEISPLVSYNLPDARPRVHAKLM